MGCCEESSILQSWNISTTLYHGLNIFLWIEVLGISGTKVCGFFCGSATAMAATERLFEALRVYCSVILSTDRGLVVPRFCKGDKELRVCGFFGGSATATATTERFFETLRVNNVEVLSVEDKSRRK